MDPKFIGTVVKRHRESAGLSRVDLARLSGVGKTTIFDVEHGKETVQLRSLLRLLNTLNIKIRLESKVMDTLIDQYRRVN